MMIFEDIKAKALWLYGSDALPTTLRAWLSDATLSMVLYRTMSWLNQYFCGRPFGFLFQKINSILCGAVFGMNVKFGKRFIVLHSVGVIVNSAVFGGDDITLESGVVIGAEKGKSPSIGSRVFIGSGAKILGGITIGDDVVIGANAVVVKNVASGMVVGGIPAKVIHDKSGDELK